MTKITYFSMTSADQRLRSGYEVGLIKTEDEGGGGAGSRIKRSRGGGG